MAKVRNYEDCHKFINDLEYKLCNKCESWFPCNSDYFYPIKNKTDCLYPYCKKCAIDSANEWKVENPERHKELYTFHNKSERKKLHDKQTGGIRTKRNLLNWQRKNPDRVRFNNNKRKSKIHEITDIEWGYCREYFNNNCAYCGISWEEHISVFGQDFHKEHVIHDGRNDLKNCVPSCKSCNSEKHEFTLNQWFNIHNPRFNRLRYLRIYQWLRFDVYNFVEQKKKGNKVK